MFEDNYQIDKWLGYPYKYNSKKQRKFDAIENKINIFGEQPVWKRLKPSSFSLETRKFM